MKSLEQWLEEYGESHQNPTNKKIHVLAVPAIMLSIVGLLWCIPTPWDSTAIYTKPAGAILALISLYYIVLSLKVFVGMLLFIMGSLALCHKLESIGTPILEVSVVLFVVAWIFQFIGHKIEGKKPSFFQDIQFLFIGPAWVMEYFFSLNTKKEGKT